MENVNLVNAQQGASTEMEVGKVVCWILSDTLDRYRDSGSVPVPYETRVRFYKNGIEDKTRWYRVAAPSVRARLKSEELVTGDLLEVGFSKDGKEVVHMVKLGHLCFEDETT